MAQGLLDSAGAGIVGNDIEADIGGPGRRRDRDGGTYVIMGDREDHSEHRPTLHHLLGIPTTRCWNHPRVATGPPYSAGHRFGSVSSGAVSGYRTTFTPAGHPNR